MALVSCGEIKHLFDYLETYRGRLEQWLRAWRIAIINVSKSTAVLFPKTARCIQKPRPVQFLGQSMDHEGETGTGGGATKITDIYLQLNDELES
jgi:hypothetical protein